MNRLGIFAPAVVWTLLPASAGAQEASRMPEYQLKALYLWTLCDYVQWPKGTGVEDKSQPFRIGVLGDSPFQGLLDSAGAAKRIQGHQVRLQISSRVRDLMDSNVIFICESESDRLIEILRALRGKPILTIGDSPEFANRGVMVNLLVQEKQVRIEINLKAIRSNGMEISPQVLKLAKIVE